MDINITELGLETLTMCYLAASAAHPEPDPALEGMVCAREEKS